MAEGKLSPDHVAIDAPGGFLFELWSMFLDIYNAKTREKRDDSVVEYGLNVYMYDYLVKKKLHHTAKTFMTEVQVSAGHVAIDAPGGFLSKWWSVFWAFFIARTNEKHFESAAETQQGKADEQMKQPNPVNTEISQPHMDAGRIHHGQMVHGRYQGLNTGVGDLPLKGWPVTGIDDMRQGLGPQVQKAFLHNQGQFQLPTQQQPQQQIMARDQVQGDMTNSSMYGQQNANDGSIGHPMLSNSSNPSTPSTHTPVQGVAITGNMEHVNNMPKWPVMYGSDAIGGVPSSANQMDDMEPFEDLQPLEDNAKSFSNGGVPSSANQLAVMEAFEDVDVESLFKSINWNPFEFIEAQQDKAKEQQIQMNQPNPMNTETSQPHMDSRMALLKPGTTHHGEMVQGSPQGRVSASCKQICNCLKSKCLHLNCECFGAGFYCSTDPPCSCMNCLNTPTHNDTILASRKKIESRDPFAFAPKIIGRSSDSVHRRGCNCKKSNCSKKYCECFQGGAGCSFKCKCQKCKNTFGPKPS